MRISVLRLRDVKRHERLDLQLAPGLTVIRGPNEAGKSTVQRALEMALFRRVTSTAQELEGVRRWGAAAADPSVDLEFEVEGVEGRLVKVFAGARGSAELVMDGERLVDPGAVDQRMAELTGLPSERFFRSTASVRHQELADLDRDEGALRDRLQQSMSGADRGTWMAKRKLEDKIRGLRSQGAKNPGEPKRLRDEVARIAAQVTHGEADLGRLERDRQALTDAREERARLDRQLAEERQGLEESARAVALQIRRDDADARYARYRRAAELQEQIAWKESSHPAALPLQDLREGVERLRALEYSLSEQRAELASQADAPRYDAAIPEPRWRPWAWAAGLLAIAAVIVAIAGAAAGLAVSGIVAGTLLAGLALAALVWVSRLRRLAADVRMRNALRADEVRRLEEGRADLARRVESDDRDRQAVLGRLAVDDLGAGERLLSAETEHGAAIDQLRAELRGLLGDEVPADLARQRDGAAAEAEQARHALAGMGEVGGDPQRHRARYEAAVRTTEAQRERSIAAEAAAQARVDHNTVDAEEVAAWTEQLEARRRELAEAERRLRIYELTLSSLNAAERATMKKAARYLEQRMGADVERITAGRYRRVEVDEEELAFRVWSPERDDWVDVRQLSQGTVDQFYLSARLGLVRQVTQHRRPPLVFDDPFVTFDDARAVRTFELLRSLAADHQVLYLTSSNRYDALADAVIELPAPDAGEAAPGSDAPTVTAARVAPTGAAPTVPAAPTARTGAAPNAPAVPAVSTDPAAPVQQSLDLSDSP